MKAGFKKYKGSYKRSKSPFTDNNIDYNEAIGASPRYKDRAKQDLKEANMYRKHIKKVDPPPLGIRIAGTAAGVYGVARGARDTARTVGNIKAAVKGGKLAKAGGYLAKSGLVSTALPIVGGYLLAREAIRGVQRRREKSNFSSPYQKYDSAYKRDSSPFSKEKKPDDKKKKRKYKQGELKKGFGEGLKMRIDMTMEQAVKEAKEKNRLAKIERRKLYGKAGIDY